MVLHSLRLQNWRSLQDLELKLSDGLNLVCGPNESGKSTLREALRAAFLSPSRGRGKHPLASSRPWGSPKATPRIELSFTHQGAQWKLLRVFFAEGCSLEKDGRLIAKDDAVPAALESSLALLWTVQGDVDPPSVPAELRAQLTAGEVVSPGLTWLEGRLQELCDEYWTPTGRPKKSLGDARMELVRLEGERDALQAELDAADRLSAEVVSLRAELETLQAQQRELVAAIEGQRPLLGAWDKYRKELAELALVEAEVKQLNSWLARWQQQQESFERLQGEQQTYASRLAALQPEPPPDRASIEQLQLRLQYAQGRAQQAMRAELEALGAPTPEQVGWLEGLEGRLQGLESRAWDAELSALGPLTAQLDGAPLQLEAGQQKAWKSAGGFTLEFPGLARLTLRAESSQELEALRQQRQTILASWRVGSLQEGRERQQRAAHLWARLAGQAPVDLTEMRGRFWDWAALDRLRPEELQAEIQALPERILQAETDWRDASGRQQQLSAQLQALLARNPAALLEQCEQQMRQLTSEQDVPADQVRIRLEERSGRLQQAPRPPEGGEVSHEGVQAQERQLESLRQQASELDSRLQQGVGRLEGTRGLYPRWVRAQESYHREAALQARREREASSVRVLADVFQASKQRLETDVVGPLRERIEGRLARLTGERYRGVDLKADFRPEGLVTSGGLPAGLGDLSFGTREQVAFLARLCLAELLSEKERHLAVFDDSLVHTDSTRMELACSLLDEAAQSAQLLVLTCHPERFESLRSKAAFHTLKG